MARDFKYIKGGDKLVFNAAGYALNEQAQTAIALAADFRNQVLSVVGTGTVIVYGSAQKNPPDFTQASTIDNSYTPIALADYSLVTNNYLAGAAGVTVAGETKLVELNTNLLSWIGIFRDSATVEVKLTITDNQ